MATARHFLMIRPTRFDFNEQTAVNNYFQSRGAHPTAAAEKAMQEFDAMVSLLREKHVDILVINDTPEPHTPDAVFPNNWISFSPDGTVILYPMFAPNRRMERKPEVLKTIREHFLVRQVWDLSEWENSGIFLEGTGSMVLDHEHKLAYAALSPRTDASLLDIFCRKSGYQAIPFHATDLQGEPIYHTNVLMCVADRFVVICLESIIDPIEKEAVTRLIRESGKELIAISQLQLAQFAGNMLQVENSKGEKMLVLSSSAYASLQPDQLSRLSSYQPLLPFAIPTIEQLGGGSTRCMMAEIFLSPVIDDSGSRQHIPL